jgi:beta-glucosidase
VVRPIHLKPDVLPTELSAVEDFATDPKWNKDEGGCMGRQSAGGRRIIPFMNTRLIVLPFLLLGIGCTSNESSKPAPPSGLGFGRVGPIAGPVGIESFTFGAATAAAQIEEPAPASDWFVFTSPEPMGIGRGTDINRGVKGYSRALDDVALMEELGLDAYRFNVSWSRIEPQRDQIDQGALAHYRALLEALVSRGIKPMVTIHHFSSPIWIDDIRRRESCADAGIQPSDTDLCGWSGAGAHAVAEELGEFAGLLAAEYGDLVDEWCTLNEPVNYILASYGSDTFPPGRGSLLGLATEAGVNGLLMTLENYVEGHVQVYDAIKAADTVDADGDGQNALVGFSLNVNDWSPARDGKLSENPDDIAAANNVWYLYHYLIVDAILSGQFDRNLNRMADEDEAHPNWAGKLDWLGVQYYARFGVTGAVPIIAAIGGLPCVEGLPLTDGCLTVEDRTKCVPDMGYEYYEPGVYKILKDFSARWPDLPMTITESGLATDTGARRSEHMVRSLEQIARARDEGVDVRGYYHWSLMDNFEWALGFKPRFGLYSVNAAEGDYTRTKTEGAETYQVIIANRLISDEMLALLGGTGPMSPVADTAKEVNELCLPVE